MPEAAVSCHSLFEGCRMSIQRCAHHWKTAAVAQMQATPPTQSPSRSRPIAYWCPVRYPEREPTAVMHTATAPKTWATPQGFPQPHLFHTESDFRRAKLDEALPYRPQAQPAQPVHLPFVSNERG